VGQGIKKAIEEESHGRIEVIVDTTAGSIANARLIKEGKADIALIQNDIALRDSSVLRGIASLYTEVVQIVTRKELGITSINGLRDRKVSVGPKNSGTLSNAFTILGAFDIALKDTLYLSFGDAKDSLLAGTIHAAFITAGYPTPAIRYLEEARKINFVSMPNEMVRELRKNYPILYLQEFLVLITLNDIGIFLLLV